MQFGAGTLAAKLFGAREIVDPRPYAVNTIAAIFEQYPAIGILLPAMGYGPEQIRDLEATINRVPCVCYGLVKFFHLVVRHEKNAF